MTSSTVDLERRLSTIERELRAWRVLGLAAIVAAAAVSCDAPSEQLSELDFTSADGAHHVHLDANGMRIEAGERHASYTEEHVMLEDGAGSALLSHDLLTIEGEAGALSSLAVASVRVSSGTARAGLSVEAGTTGIVEALGEHGVARLGATEGEATLALEGSGEPQVRASAGADRASVTVLGTGGAAHAYGAD